MSGSGNHQFGLKAELNDSFKSDIEITNYGYLKVLVPSHPFCDSAGKIFIHRLIAEEQERLRGGKFYVEKRLNVHHKNHNRLDNRPENLEIMTKSDHVSLHNKIRMEYFKNMGIIASKDIFYMKMPKAPTPSRTKKLDAGTDIRANENIVIAAGESALIGTGISVAIPDGHVGLLWSRSGLSVKNRIEVGAGCIDQTYRGEVKVHLYNMGTEAFVVSVGDRIAQMLVMPINVNDFLEVNNLDKTDRGDKGFGSSGVA